MGEGSEEANSAGDPIVLLTLDDACGLLIEQGELLHRIQKDKSRLDIVSRQVVAMQHLLSDEQWTSINEHLKSLAAPPPGRDGAGPGTGEGEGEHAGD